MIKWSPKCSKCGEKRVINPFTTLPVMVGFELEDGTTINICNSCLMKLGTMPDEEKEKFFDGLKGE